MFDFTWSFPDQARIKKKRKWSYSDYIQMVYSTILQFASLLNYPIINLPNYPINQSPNSRKIWLFSSIGDYPGSTEH